jgi:pimeloyl-ACP methyl ester carboxylesterase
MDAAQAGEYTHGWLPGVPVEYLTLGSNGPRVRFLRAGQGPNLLLMHTVRTQLDIFQRVIPRLLRHFTVYAFDYPGFGWSEIVPNADYREPALRRRVVQFVEQLGLRDLTLAGESMGATLALTASTELREQVKQVVAFNTYDYLPGLERANLFASIIIKSVRLPIVGPVFAALENKAILKGVLRGGVVDSTTLPASFIDELNRVGKRKGYSQLARAVYRSLPSYVAARSLYQGVTVPVTMVYGDRDWSRPGDREGAIALVRNARTIIIPNTGHFAALESPEEVSRILLSTKSAL